MSAELTPEEVTAQLAEWGGVDDTPQSQVWLSEAVDRLNMWLVRGDGIAIYTNQDMGHPDLGDKRFVSYGSAVAQLETDTPPAILPDGIGGGVNWRYALTGTYRGTSCIARSYK